jgi:uncharacterized protein Usg
VATPFFALREDQIKPEALLQPGMNVTYSQNSSTRAGIVEEVHLRAPGYRHLTAKYEYSIGGNHLHDHLVISSAWQESGARPEFLNSQEYFLYVERRGDDPIKATVQVQTSLKGGADVILYSADKKEFYRVRKTILQKMIKNKSAWVADQSKELHAPVRRSGSA